MTSQQEADDLLEFRRDKLSQGLSKEEIDTLLMLVDVVDWENLRSKDVNKAAHQQSISLTY